MFNNYFYHTGEDQPIVTTADSDLLELLLDFIKHPSVVHFPIAYSVAIPFVAFVIYKAIASKTIKLSWWYSVVFTQFLVFLLLLLARYTGNLLYSEHGYDLNPTSEIQLHSTLGTYSIYINLVLLIVSILPFLLQRNQKNPKLIMRTYILLAFGNALFILYIGYLGGQIVWG